MAANKMIIWHPVYEEWSGWIGGEWTTLWAEPLFVQDGGDLVWGEWHEFACNYNIEGAHTAICQQVCFYPFFTSFAGYRVQVEINVDGSWKKVADFEVSNDIGGTGYLSVSLVNTESGDPIDLGNCHTLSGIRLRGLNRYDGGFDDLIMFEYGSHVALMFTPTRVSEAINL
jgi:hypothetical protein